MRLSTRLSLFFLVSLAIVLLGFSAALYVMASDYLYRQADERLEAALNTLAAAAEIGPDGVEWGPHERSLSFGRRHIEGLFAWQVSTGRGKRIDGSSSPGGEFIFLKCPPQVPNQIRTVSDDFHMMWRVMHRSTGSSAFLRHGTGAF